MNDALVYGVAGAVVGLVATPGVLRVTSKRRPNPRTLSDRARAAWALGLSVLCGAVTAVTVDIVDDRALPAALVLVVVMTVAAAVDIRVQRLPNLLVLPAITIVFGWLCWTEFRHPADGSLGGAILSFLGVLVVTTLGALWTPRGLRPIGMGDSRFLALPALVLGYRADHTIIVMGVVIGALVLLVGYWWWSPRGPSGTMPLGPLICGGALVALWWPRVVEVAPMLEVAELLAS